MADDPPALPPSLAEALRPVLPGLADETIAAIGREVPDYQRPMSGPFGQGVRMGVERALARFVDDLEHPGEPDPQVREVYVALGRGEQRAGRPLDGLLGAYRLGARLAWERFAAAAEAAGHEPRTVYALAGAIFTYIDAISAESVEGYAEEQSREAGERARVRRALGRMLGRDDVREEELRDLAAVAGWPLPRAVAALVTAPADRERALRALSRLGPDVVVVAEENRLVAWLPDPDGPGRRAALERVGQELGAPLALGPPADPSRGHHSLHRAALAARLAADGRIEAGGLVDAHAHLLELLLRADAALAADLADAVLAPLDGLPTAAASTRARETLRAWLDHPGQPTRMAEQLGLHPQTVRYRVAQLRELLGDDALDDPDRRFALAVAIRATS